MSATGEDWERWGETTGVRERVQKLVEKHRHAPKTTAGKYLAKKRIELARELEAGQIIYLDTKHWVNLCHVLVQSPKLDPAYNDILASLEMLRQKGRICCPVSSALFWELMRQSDTFTRQRTARIMDFLSGGVCLQNWLDLAKAEFGRHICRTFHIEGTEEATFPTWTKVGYWAGEHLFEFRDDAARDSALMETVYIDLHWEMTCEEYQAMPDWIPTPDAFSAAWVAGSEEAKSRLAALGRGFPDLVRDRRRQLLSALRGNLSSMYALCRGLQGSPADHVAAVLDPIYEGRDPKALPSLEVVAGLDAAIVLDTARRVEANDMEDYLHAAQALPYCDALFCTISWRTSYAISLWSLERSIKPRLAVARKKSLLT